MVLRMVATSFWMALAVLTASAQDTGTRERDGIVPQELDRSPVDLAISSDGDWIVSANQTSNSVSLIDVNSGTVRDEIRVGEKPQSIAFCPDGQHVLVSSSEGGEVAVLKMGSGSLNAVGVIKTGFHPHGIAINNDGTLAYVALTAANQVAVIDVTDRKMVGQIPVGRGPRFLTLSTDGTKLAVGTSGDRGISIVDIKSQSVISQDKFMGLNIGHLHLSQNGHQVWFPWVVYRQNPISEVNIRLGWVLATRLGRIDLDGTSRREAMSLDPPGKAIGDPHGIAETSDEKQLVVSAAGTHEVLIYQTAGLPMQSRGSTDHVPNELLEDKSRFSRIDVGGRPMGLRITGDNRRAFVANYLNNSIQEIDLMEHQLVREIRLGGPATPSLVRRGEAIFYDAQRSLDQWYSCHTCHYEGGSNSVAMDTMNDGSRFTFKTVLPLHGVAETGPWLWHGNRDDLAMAVRRSITSTMMGPEPSADDVAAVVAYLEHLKPSPSPWQPVGKEQIAAWQRGRDLFASERAGCVACHEGQLYSDGLNHDLGLHDEQDRYDEFNTPSLRGVFSRTLLLHDGRSQSLEDLLKGPHAPQITGGTAPLTEEELQDLIIFLKSL